MFYTVSYDYGPGLLKLAINMFIISTEADTECNVVIPFLIDNFASFFYFMIVC